jgi:peptide/nickel transport system permease protein
VALAFLAVLVAVALLAPLLAPFNPDKLSLGKQYLGPAWGDHLLGTDRFGRDELSRLIFGARVSLLAAVIGSSVALLVGSPLGFVAGFLGGWTDRLLSFINDSLMSVPGLVFALAALALVGPGLVNAMVIVGVLFSPAFFRLARSATLDVMHETFIEASRAMGCSTTRILVCHVLPNALTAIVIQVAATSGASVTAEASLSFLGLGVRPPTASWGSMMSTAAQDLYSGAHLVYLPGLAIASTVLAFSLLGDWLRDRVGTRSRRAQ